MKRIALCLLFSIHVILTASCSPFTPKARQAPEGGLPDTYSLYAPREEPGRRWWEEFGASDLNRLVDEALSKNFTLKEAWARLRQVRARAVQAGADLYPDLTGEVGAVVGRQRSADTGATVRSIEDYAVGLVSRYEIDLWGRIRSENEAALLEVSATREDLNAAAITVAAEVTTRWTNIIAQRLQKKLLERQLEINRTLQELIELRFRNSMVSALDVYQQKQVVENIEAEIPLVEAEEARLRHELALLLGRPPRSEIVITAADFPAPAGVPATGLPADLLALRPDVRAVGQRLKAADWQIAAARANRLPSITLTARARYGQGDLENIFDNWLLSLAGDLSAPLFDGNRRSAEVDRSRAAADERLWAYRRTVLTAVREVEDALVTENKQREHLAALKRVAETSQRALEEAGIRYRNGLNDYLPVLTQLLAVQDLEKNLIRQRATLLNARVGLYRALGGTWTERLVSPSEAGISQEGQNRHDRTP